MPKKSQLVSPNNPPTQQATETGHIVDNAQSELLSAANRQGNVPQPVRPADVPEGVRPPRRQVAQHADGFQSVVMRRSPRRDAQVGEDRDFVPEAPAKRPKTSSVKASNRFSTLNLVQGGAGPFPETPKKKKVVQPSASEEPPRTPAPHEVSGEEASSAYI